MQPASISTSQSISVPLALGQQCINGSHGRRPPTRSGTGPRRPSGCQAACRIDSRLCKKMAVHIAMSPAATRVVSRKPVPVSSPHFRGNIPANADAIRCGKWLVRANAPIVILRCHLHNAGTESSPKSCGLLQNVGSGLLRRRDDNHAAFQQTFMGVAGAALLRPRQRMTANESAPRRQ